MEYKISYSNRKNIGIYVRKDGSIEVRAPRYISVKTIEEVLEKKYNWIEKAKNKIAGRKEINVSDEERERLRCKAREIIPKKVEIFSKLMGVTPKSVRIGNSMSYWGCCSGDNRLNFSWRLMIMEDDVIDYVVVHELSHIKEHNHSSRFWSEVERVIPNYISLREKLNNWG